MVRVLSLSQTATLVAVETLLQHPPEVCSWLIHRLHRLLENDYYSTVSGSVLERLCTYYPHNVTDDILLLLAPPDLHKLHLVRCDNITSSGIIKVLEKCPLLMSLTLQDCRCAGNVLCDINVTSGCFLDITCSKQRPGYNLTYLDLSRCELVTDSTVKNILQNVRSLKEFHLVACTGITDEVFLLDEKKQLMRNERSQQVYSCNLTAVDISSCSQLTSTAVRHLTTLCGPSLKYINISATNADCMALLFLSGYSILTSLHITKQMDPSILSELSLITDDSSSDMNIRSHNDKRETAAPACQKIGACSDVNVFTPNGCSSCECDETKPISSLCSNCLCHGGSDNCKCCCDVSVNSAHSADLENSYPFGTQDSVDMESSCLTRVFPHTFHVDVVPILEFGFQENPVIKTDNCDQFDHSTNTQHINQINPAFSDKPEGAHLDSSDLFSASGASCSGVSECHDDSKAYQLSFDQPSSGEYPCDRSVPEKELETHRDSSAADCDNVFGAVGGIKHLETDSNSSSEQNTPGCSLPLPRDVNNEFLYPSLFKSNLEGIDLSYIELGDRETGSICLYHLLLKNANMKQLSLSWKELDDEIIETVIVAYAPQLKSVSLVDCQTLTTYGVAVLCDSCKNLSSLNLQGVNFIQDRGICHLLSNDHVTRLGLSETMITDYTLSKMAALCSDKLSDLDLSWCEEITEKGITEVASNCTNLHRCLLRRCPVTEEALHLVAKNCTNLRYLNISGINTLIDGHLVAIALKLRHLQYLDIGWNLEVTDVGVSALLRYSYTLRTLVATGVKQITSRPFWPLVSDVQAFKRCKALLSMEKKLRHEQRDEDYMIISSDEDDANVISIPLRSTCYAPDLNQLQLEWCDCVSDSDLAEIVLVCRGSLHITDYYGIKVQPAFVINSKSR